MMLTTAQAFLFTLAVLALMIVIRRYRQKRIGTLSVLLWLPLWGVVAAVILFPNITMVAARLLGIGRGADLVLYLSVIAILYLLFRVGVRLERIDREITQIVRTLALRLPADPQENPPQERRP